ncbi:MAG TPA: PEP/pyruvate-binding domain-containing protein [Blastocatellia bacterium]|nr:PEP/pyruvate-binding domain-containing protein [Blastocatellia bacterium]
MNRSIDTNIKPLDEITAGDEARSGAKAYNCARLRQAGFLVPDGLVVLSTASAADLEGLADHTWFDGLPIDALFAVRSSGIGEDGEGQSFAGIHQTLLNVCRADLGRAVEACRASARTAQALEYRRAKGISIDTIEMGVLIQLMIHPVAAGVAFTVNPVTGADDELVINSSWGVGEALVSGQVEPDEFVIRKRDGELLWSRVGEKGTPGRAMTLSLAAGQVRELARILIGIEGYYGAPQDVEWCHDGTGFWVVQSRPVTTARPRVDETEWTRANLVEVLPDVTSPQALSAFEEMLNQAERQYMGDLIAPDHVLGPMVKSFCGRLYFNLSQVRRVCALGAIAPADMLRSMGHTGTIQPSDEKPQPLGIGDRMSVAGDLLRIMWRHLRAARLVRTHEAKSREAVNRMAEVDPRRLSDEEVWAVIEEWVGDAPNYMQTVLLLTGVLFHETPVRKLCEKVGFEFERLVYPQLAMGERSVSAQQAFDLVALARTARTEPTVVKYLCDQSSDLSRLSVALRGTAFLSGFKRFLETYGHRGRYEYDWSLPRYSEDATALLRIIRAHLEGGSEKSSSETALRQERDARDAWAAFAGRLSLWQKLTMLPRIRRGIQRIKQYYVWREQVRSDLVRVLAAMRAWNLVLADRFVHRGWLDGRDDYFLIHFREIAAVIKGERRPETLRAIAAERRLETARRRSIQMPLLMRESELAEFIRAAGVSSRVDDEGELSGHPVSGGCVEGEVVVVHDPADFDLMKPGAILVAPATDPSWTPLFTLASGVIVEVGGVLSHASTVAREYGLPALANVKHATRRLRTGDRVRLDAIRGLVHRLQHTAASVESREFAGAR